MAKNTQAQIPLADAQPSIDEDLELMQDVEEEYEEETLDEVLVVIDDIMEKESRNGDSRVWLKGRYQSENGGYPKKVIHIWGLDGRDMRKLFKHSKANPFVLVSLIGSFDIRQSQLPGGMAGNEIHSLSNACINSEDGEWITETLEKKQIIKRRSAAKISKQELARRKAQRQPAQINNLPSHSQAMREALVESQETVEEQDEVSQY